MFPAAQEVALQHPLPQAPNRWDRELADPLGHTAVSLPFDYLSFVSLAAATNGGHHVTDLFVIHLQDGVSSPSLLCILKRCTS